MSLSRGRVVCSKLGRDKDKFLVLMSIEGGFCYVCDGKERPLLNPKRKNEKHLAATNCFLSEEQMTTNRALKKALAEIAWVNKNGKEEDSY